MIEDGEHWIEFPEADKWRTKVEAQEGLKLSFEEELALGAKELDTGNEARAFLHMYVAERKLGRQGDWERRETWLQTMARMHHALGMPNEAIGCLFWGEVNSAWSLGTDHPMPRRFEALRCQLEWAGETGQAALFHELVDTMEQAEPHEPPDHQRSTENLASFYETWSRCMDAAKWLSGLGNNYWAEVALRAAQKLGGHLNDPRQAETCLALVALYEKAGKPWLAKKEIQDRLGLRGWRGGSPCGDAPGAGAGEPGRRRVRADV